jgi:hypothetical protein
MLKQTPYIVAGGGVLMALIFLISGFGKITAPTMTMGYINAVHLPFPMVAHIISIIIEIRWRHTPHQRIPGAHRCGGNCYFFRRRRAELPQQLRRSQPDDEFPEENLDGGWTTPGLGLRRWKLQHRQSESGFAASGVCRTARPAAAAADLADALRSQHLQTLNSQTPKDLS